jgi:hypothetical protein
VTGSSEARAALERGGRVVLVTPPAPEQAGMVWELIGTPEPADEGPGPAALPGHGPGVPAAVILTADRATALEWAAAAPPDRALHPVTGLDRTTRLLKEGVDVPRQSTTSANCCSRPSAGTIGTLRRRVARVHDRPSARRARRVPRRGAGRAAYRLG